MWVSALLTRVYSGCLSLPHFAEYQCPFLTSLIDATQPHLDQPLLPTQQHVQRVCVRGARTAPDVALRQLLAHQATPKAHLRPLVTYVRFRQADEERQAG